MSEVQLLIWMTGIHLVGFLMVGLLVIPALRDNGERGDQDGGGSDDGWGNLPNVKPDSGGWPGGGIPLPDADQSRVRLRGPGRITEPWRPVRRRVHEPEPARRPVRTHSH
jgi:hypothetical protein